MQLRILLVDDDQDLLEIISRRLEHVGYKVTAVMDGFEAVRVASKQTFDLILLDVMMPRIDGIETCRRIRASAGNASTPIIMQTAKDQREDVIKAIRQGATDYIVKPYSNKVLIERIEKHMADKIKSSGAHVVPESSVVEEVPSLDEAIPETTGKARVESILLRVRDLPAVPYVGDRLIKISRRSESDVTDLTHTVSLDPSLVLKVLRAANSSFYGFQESVTDVSHAIVRLGFRGVIDLVVSDRVMEFESALPPRWDRLRFWEHSLGVALIARKLFASSADNGADVGFLAGLIHDVGKTIFDEYLSKRFTQALHYAWQEGIPLREAEMHTIGAQHTYMGRELLDKWRIPKIYRDVVFYHHYPWESDRVLDHLEQNTLDLIHIVRLGDILCRMFGVGRDGSHVVEEIPDEMMKQIGLSRTGILSLMSDILDELSKIRQDLGIHRPDIRKTAAAAVGRRIIYLDETLRTVNAGKLILQHADAKINAAFDASEIIALIKARQPDLLVLEMTDAKNAQDLITKVEDITGKPYIPILLSEGVQNIPEDFLMERPHVKVLPSPFQVNVFDELISELLMV